jgi:hypothetical protein
VEVKLHFFLYMELQVPVTLPLGKIVVLSEQEADQSQSLCSLQPGHYTDWAIPALAKSIYT